METGKNPGKIFPKGNDLMKKLTSKIVRILFIVSSICIFPVSGVMLYEIFSGVSGAHQRNNTVGVVFWSTLAVYYLCAWYMSSKKKAKIAE